MQRFADYVAGQIRSQDFSWSEGLMAPNYVSNGKRGGRWAQVDAREHPNDWDLYSSGLTWRGIELWRGLWSDRTKVHLSKRDKQLLWGAYRLAKQIAKINRKKAKLENKEREALASHQGAFL